MNPDVQSRLAEIDPEEARFAQYHSASCEDVESNRDVLACGQGKPVRHVVLMKRLNPFSEKLTRAQFRYLRESLEILHKNGILHGDLPGNVMVDPMDGMPRIIDWGNSSIVPPSDPFLRHEMTHLVSGQFYKGVSDKD
jgi:serine/threonine protein kinase